MYTPSQADVSVQPIFFCRDPIQGPDVIRSQSRNPKNFLLDYDATFDLLACTPEGYDILRLFTIQAYMTVETTPD